MAGNGNRSGSTRSSGGTTAAPAMAGRSRRDQVNRALDRAGANLSRAEGARARFEDVYGTNAGRMSGPEIQRYYQLRSATNRAGRAWDYLYGQNLQSFTALGKVSRYRTGNFRAPSSRI